MSKPTDQFFYGHGKLLLSGEYFVLNGAMALALPTQLGQSLSVRYQTSEKPKINWRSFDQKGTCWFEADFELWHFDILSTENKEEAKVLQKILRQARVQNPHFLRDDQSAYVETRIEFPLEWGLGSSSTLLYNIAQWAYVSPFELGKNTLGGSGYDIACAQSFRPIFFQNVGDTPEWQEADFNPSFSENLFFVYLNKKKKTSEDLERFKNLEALKKAEILKELTEIARAMTDVEHLSSFESLMIHHEKLIASTIGLETVKELYFQDYPGAIKSLGAWGGDFCLATSTKPFAEVKKYFKAKGFDVVLRYTDLIKVRTKHSYCPVESSYVQLNF